MRNLMAHLSLYCNLGGKTVSVVSYRPKLQRAAGAARSMDEDTTSLVLQVVVPQDYNLEKVVGWELNTRGKPGPRWVNLRPLLDKHHLAVQAADLNLVRASAYSRILYGCASIWKHTSLTL